MALPFGKKGEKPFGVSADDVPLTHIICRTPRCQRPATDRRGAPRRRSIDHIAFTVADFDPARAKAKLTALGVRNVRDGGPFSVYADDPFGYEVQISGIGVTALCGAGDRPGCGIKVARSAERKLQKAVGFLGLR